MNKESKNGADDSGVVRNGGSSKKRGKQSNWKGFERKIAKVFRGKRIVRPDWGVEDLDVVAEPFGIECKYRKQINNQKALEQAEYIIGQKKERQGLIPLAVTQKPGTVGKEEVVFRLSTLQRLGLAEIKPEVAEDIWIVPLGNFLETLEDGGIDYGTDEE